MEQCRGRKTSFRKTIISRFDFKWLFCIDSILTGGLKNPFDILLANILLVLIKFWCKSSFCVCASFHWNWFDWNEDLQLQIDCVKRCKKWSILLPRMPRIGFDHCPTVIIIIIHHFTISVCTQSDIWYRLSVVSVAWNVAVGKPAGF